MGLKYLALCLHTGIAIELVMVSWLFSNSLFLWAPRSNSARDLTQGVEGGYSTKLYTTVRKSLPVVAIIGSTLPPPLGDLKATGLPVCKDLSASLIIMI